METSEQHHDGGGHVYEHCDGLDDGGVVGRMNLPGTFAKEE